MLMQKVTPGNRPEAVSVQAECLDNTWREGKTLGGSRVCERKQVKYMEDSSKEIYWHKSPAPCILATRRHPDESVQNTHREKDNWVLLLSLDTQG